jgi:hypothetical protein
MSEKELFKNVLSMIDQHLKQSYQTIINSEPFDQLFLSGGARRIKRASKSKSRRILPQPSKKSQDSLSKYGYKYPNHP